MLIESLGWGTGVALLGLMIPAIAAPGMLRREPPPTPAALARARSASVISFLRRSEAPAILLLALVRLVRLAMRRKRLRWVLPMKKTK